MEKYQLTPEAVSDLLEICDFISQDNPEATRSKTVLRACDLTCQFSISWSRKERSDSPASPLLGGATVFDLLIVYAREKKPLQIIRILHGARDLPSVLM